MWMIKSKFGAEVRSKLPVSKRNELLRTGSVSQCGGSGSVLF